MCACTPAFGIIITPAGLVRNVTINSKLPNMFGILYLRTILECMVNDLLDRKGSREINEKMRYKETKKKGNFCVKF